MSKVGIIYWSSTGNTEAMAQAVEEGAKAAGADVEIMEVADADVDKALSFDVLALGCPAMGDEELEDGEFEPFFSDLEGKLSGHKEACGKPHLLQSIDTHQVSRRTDNGKVSAKSCRKYQWHQKTASGIPGLIGDSTDYRDQHCCSTCIG